jgi:pectate lyase
VVGGGAGEAGAGGAGGSLGASLAALAGGASGAAAGGTSGAAGDSAGGSGVAPAFCDDFEDGDAGGWTPEGGTWAITEEESLTLEGGPGTAMAIASDTDQADQIVEARVQVLAFGSNGNSYRAGVVARFAGGSNYYALGLAGNGVLRLLKGNATISGCTDHSANVAPGNWYTLRLEVTGPASSVRLSAFIDGEPAQSCTLTSNTVAAGRAGVFTYGSGTSALFDEVVVWSP